MGVMGDSVQVQKGLEGVVADTTAVLVDGEGGHLYYRGQPIETLIKHTFAEVLHLVVFGELLDRQRLQEVEEYLWTAGRAAGAGHVLRERRVTANIRWRRCNPSRRSSLEPPAVSLGRNALEEEGLLVAARVPAAIGLIHAALEDHLERPYPSLRRYGERFLQLMHDGVPTPEQVKALRDHADPAARSQLQRRHVRCARRVVDVGAAVRSLVGGDRRAVRAAARRRADQHALEMALEVGSPQQAQSFVANCLATGRLVMGMGHREYRVVDPRAR